ncbi:MAG TPA: DinB family protein [Saprospiraceae bacterium]|nr:DinB family protein [Saprospiraceae bacterium]
MKILKRLDSKLEKLFKEMDEFPEEELSIQLNGKWSPLQVCEHLRFSEERSQSYVRYKLQKGNELPETNGWQGVKTWLLKMSLSFDGIKLKAPKIEGLSPDNTIQYQVLKESWWIARKALGSLLEELEEGVYKRALYKHPRTGLMNIGHMLIFFEAHFDRHHRQIANRLHILKKLSKNPGNTSS